MNLINDLFINNVGDSSRLVKNYNNRLNNFVFDMATKPDPIIIKDYSNPVNNPREVFLQEEQNKIIGSHGLIFNKYQNVKERIVSIIIFIQFILFNYHIHRNKSSMKNSKARVS